MLKGATIWLAVCTKKVKGGERYEQSADLDVLHILFMYCQEESRVGEYTHGPPTLSAIL